MDNHGYNERKLANSRRLILRAQILRTQNRHLFDSADFASLNAILDSRTIWPDLTLRVNLRLR